VRRRPPLRSLLSLAVGLVVAGVIAITFAEALSRLYEHVVCVPQNGGFNRYDRFYGWGNRPGAAGVARGCVGRRTEYDARISIDERGFRGSATSVGRTAARRIMILGDSFTAGMQVGDDEVYPRRLEDRLNAGGVRRVEVLNAGVDAWGTDNALLYWEHDGWRYAPDLVVLAFDTTNDVFENERRLIAVHARWPDKPYAAVHDGVMTMANLPLPPLRRTRRIATDVGSVLARRSALFRVLADRGVLSYRLFFFPSPVAPPDAVAGTTFDVYRVEYPPVWSEAWRLTRGLLLRLRSQVERRRARFAVVVINAREEVVPSRWRLMADLAPGLAQIPLDRDKPNRLVTRFLARRGIPTIELLAAFRERFPDGPPGFFTWNMHWAPAGHALAAEVIAAEIERRGLLPP
jgi:hypothetical protein